jgi:polyhydroxyalkanoate synthesis regulator phasin
MNTTAERPTHTLTGDMLDAWMTSYKTMTWTQDQMETLAVSWLEQAKTMRNDGHKVLEVLVSQAKNNAEDMQKLAASSMKHVMEQVPGWDALTVSDMRRQMADLNARMDALEANKR